MSETPYLSIVATARNDNHSGNMLRRMQIFINGLLHQCQQYQLPAELIIVEWNPPVNKPRLQEVLSWPIENNPCKVRIIEVPPEIHRRFKHSEGLPLFQMIAKNVGIRRAKGEFILATNIDLLFSDELFSFLASRQLQSRVMYRIDRYDVRADVPLEVSLEEQLAYCQENIIRVNGRYGTKDVKRKRKKVEPVQQPEVINNQWLDKIPDSVIPLLSLSRKIYRRLLPVSWRDAILDELPPAIKDWVIARGLLNVQQNALSSESVNSEPVPPPLHTNACGDFTLMAKEDWFVLRGYPELEIFALHLDSLIMYMAHHGGIKEKVLEEQMRCYHIEHTSNWKPEGKHETVNKWLKDNSIAYLSYEQLETLNQIMKQSGKPIVFNDEHWGLVDDILLEKQIDNDLKLELVKNIANA